VDEKIEYGRVCLTTVQVIVLEKGGDGSAHRGVRAVKSQIADDDADDDILRLAYVVDVGHGRRDLSSCVEDRRSIM
jgi:hypothetical protein